MAQAETDFRATYPAVFQWLEKQREPYHIELQKGGYALGPPNT